MAHMGLGIVERDPSDVDYDFRFLCHMLPGLGDYSKGSEIDGGVSASPTRTSPTRSRAETGWQGTFRTQTGWISP